MKMLRLGAIAAALSLLAMPAQAATVGLLGGDFDPPPINDGQVYTFGSCGQLSSYFYGTDVFDDYTCLFYDFADIDGLGGDDAVSSIELLLTGDLSGEFEYQSVADLFEGYDTPYFQELDTAASGLIFENALRLFTDGPGIFPYLIGCEIECPDLELALFIGPDDFDSDLLEKSIAGQVVAVNGTVTVPEPASLLLFGPGALGALLARRRRSQMPLRA
jgi:hypothetical protein